MHGLERLIRQLGSLQKGYLAAQEWPKLESEAHLMAAHLHTFNPKKHTLLVNDWNQGNAPREIAIDPRKTPVKRIAELHAAVKKHKASIVRLLKQINDKKIAIATYEETPPLPPSLPLRTKHIPYHTFRSTQGLDIFVGKNALGNDFVTFKLARGNDLWLHAAHEKGAHVLIRIPKGKTCAESTLKEALQLALKHSQADKKGECEVVVAPRKQISRPPKANPGQVQVSQPKFYRVVADPTIRSRL